MKTDALREIEACLHRLHIHIKQNPEWNEALMQHRERLLTWQAHWRMVKTSQFQFTK